MNSEQEILNASILIVDDHKADVQLLEQILRKAHYRCVTSTTDPFAVCALHCANRYDLILLDLQMPSMNGFQVMEGLKQNETSGYLPIIVVSAQPSYRLQALASGAKDFISKPFNQLELRTRIHNMLEVRLLYTKLEDANKNLESMALHDGLTGLANRRLLMDRLSLSIVHARRNKHAMALIYLDLDGFKQINDSLGHDVGDILLRMVADRLLAAVRQEDTVARLGGDEFVIVLHEVSHAEGVDNLLTKIIQDVSRPYQIQREIVNMTISAGLSMYPNHGEDAATLLKSADIALYEAKRAGKNEYRMGTRPVSICDEMLLK